MKTKWPLFAGIFFLVIGIILKNYRTGNLPLIFIITGISLKAYHIISIIREGRYKPGWELLLLGAGLALFFLGKYFRAQLFMHYLYLVVPGILLKLFFILIFIKKIKATKPLRH